MRKPRLILQIIAFVAFLIVLGGVGVGVYLTSKPQDTRQRAAEQGLVDVTINPGSATYTTADPATVQIMIDSGPNVVKIEKLDFIIAKITGSIPDDLSFTLAPLPGVVKVTTSLVDVSGGKELRATLTNPSNSYSTDTQNLPMGTFRFTPKESGSMTITLDPSMSEAVKGIQGNETIRIGTSATFLFTRPTPVPTPIVTASPTPTSAPLQKTTSQATAMPALQVKQGSVTVCLVVTENGTLLTDWSTLDAESIPVVLGTNPAVSGTTGDGRATSYGSANETLQFSVPATVTTQSLLGSTGLCTKLKDPISYTVGQQPAVHITYRPVTLEAQSQFSSVSYNDQWTSTSSLASLRDYTAVLFDKDSTNDANRAFQSDGDIPINDAKPDRILTIALAKSTLVQSQASSFSLLSQAQSAPTPTLTPAPTSTPIPTTPSQISETSTPTPQPTTTSTLIAQVQQTSTPSVQESSRSNVQSPAPASAVPVDLPVSGNELPTMILLPIAALCIGMGVFIWL